MKCYLRFFCGGGCFCQSFYSSRAVGKGDITKRDPYCSTFKSIIHDVLWELASPVDVKKDIVDYEKPVIFSSMESRLPSCAVPSTRVTDFSSEVGLFHCSCVLSVDLEGKEKILGESDHRLNRDACFNELAHEYEEWLRSPIGVTYNSFAKERVYSKMGLRKGERILEVGCGTGNYALDLAMDNDVFGCDVSEWMLRVCIKKSEARKLNLSVHHIASEDLPFPDESFDAVLCVNVLEFALDPVALLEEMNRVLKKSGRLVVGVLNKNSVWGLTQGLKKSFAKGAYYEARFYTPDEIKALLQKINPGVEIDTALFSPPVNNRKILGLSKIFEGIGRKYFKNNGALIIVKALKT